MYIQNLLFWGNNEHPVPCQSARHLDIPQKYLGAPQMEYKLKNPPCQWENSNILAFKHLIVLLKSNTILAFHKFK